jgi:hypothetical protein
MSKLRLFAPASHGIRLSDAWGEGTFGAPRGECNHKGVDYLISPGERVRSPVDGVVRRIGRCYADTAEYQLVEIATVGAIVRVFYVEPDLLPGTQIFIGDTIGWAQDIAARYDEDMLNHVHLEVRLTDGVLLGRGRTPENRVWVDPEMFM